MSVKQRIEELRIKIKMNENKMLKIVAKKDNQSNLEEWLKLKNETRQLYVDLNQLRMSTDLSEV